MNFELILSEINQSQKIYSALFHLYKVSGVFEFRETESRMVVARKKKEGVMGLWGLLGTEFQCGMMKKF